MLNRLFYRLKYTAGTVIFGGIFLLFFEKWRNNAIYITLGSIIFFIVCFWLQKITEPKQSFDADENGNAKPNYR